VKAFHRDCSHSELYRLIYSADLKRLENQELVLKMDTNVSYLFRNAYVHQKLMLSRWHPSNVVYNFIVNNLLHKLGIFCTPAKPKREFTLAEEIPLTFAVKNALGMQFDDDQCYYYLGYLLSQSDYVTTLYDFYGQNMPTVDATAMMNEKKLKIFGAVLSSSYKDMDILPLFNW
jgi:hypothetical protein